MLNDRRSIGTVTAALRNNSDKVRLNATWHRIHHHYGIGTVIGANALHLSETDHRTLLALLQKDVNLNALQQNSDTLKGDRMALAEQTKNEKLSRLAVAADIVMVASLSGELALSSGNYCHPAGAALLVPAENLHGLAQLVLVENLSVMYNLQRYLWPQSVRNLPMLFRGSPQHSPAAVTIALTQVPAVICFPDYDPQGLMNSLTQHHARAVIIPTATTVNSLVKAGLNKPADWARQQSARDWLRSRQLALPLRRMLDHELALSQESMAGRELEIIYI